MTFLLWGWVNEPDESPLADYLSPAFGLSQRGNEFLHGRRGNELLACGSILEQAGQAAHHAEIIGHHPFGRADDENQFDGLAAIFKPDSLRAAPNRQDHALER